MITRLHTQTSAFSTGFGQTETSGFVRCSAPQTIWQCR